VIGTLERRLGENRPEPQGGGESGEARRTAATRIERGAAQCARARARGRGRFIGAWPSFGITRKLSEL